LPLSRTIELCESRIKLDLTSAGKSDRMPCRKHWERKGNGVQQPIAVIGAELDADPGERWDAQAKFDIGVMINRYLEQHPPEAETTAAAQLALSGRTLEGAGRTHLRRLGLRHLRSQ
jgi:hypothetical protein